ncbi:hypothetical protein ABZU32_08865 [Sphaerisporangium sp. NPDC005288]
MSRRDVQGYAQDLIALSEAQQSKADKPKPSKLPGPVLYPTKPRRR